MDVGQAHEQGDLGGLGVGVGKASRGSRGSSRQALVNMPAPSRRDNRQDPGSCGVSGDGEARGSR